MFQESPFFPSFQSRFFIVCGLDKPDFEATRRLKSRAAALRNAGIRIDSILCSEDPQHVEVALTVYKEIGGEGSTLTTAETLTDIRRYPPEGVKRQELEAAAKAKGLPPEVYMMTMAAYDDAIWHLGMSAANEVGTHMSEMKPGVTTLVCTHEGRIDSMILDLLGKARSHQLDRSRERIVPGQIVELVMVRSTRQVLYMRILTDEILGVGKINLPA